MRKIVKRRLARRDLKQIWRYSFKEWGEAQADTVFADIEAGILRLQGHPHLGKSREDLRAGYYALRVRRHVIYSLLTPSSIRIVRVPHAGMDPDQNL
jgi:toxin ParE1/3/4